MKLEPQMNADWRRLGKLATKCTMHKRKLEKKVCWAGWHAALSACDMDHGTLIHE